MLVRSISSCWSSLSNPQSVPQWWRYEGGEREMERERDRKRKMEGERGRQKARRRNKGKERDQPRMSEGR
jgi:hypothetical protein